MPSRASSRSVTGDVWDADRWGIRVPMMKLLIFAGGVATGFALCSAMSEEQRNDVRERARAATQGPRGRRLQSAARDATGSVADVAVSAVEQAADKVSSAADDLGTKITTTTS